MVTTASLILAVLLSAALVWVASALIFALLTGGAFAWLWPEMA